MVAPARAVSDPLPGWLLAGAVVAWLAVVPEAVGWSVADHDVVWAVLLIATVPLLVVGALIDELRRTPSDAEQLSHRSLEWALLAAGIVAVYTVLVAGLGRLVGGSGPTWLLVAATGAIALAIEPARRRIRHLADRLVFGSRDDPLAVVQRIVDHVGTDTGEDLLPALVRSLEQGLRFDAIAIDVAGAGRRVAASGVRGRRDGAPPRGRPAPQRRGRRSPRRRLGGGAVAADPASCCSTSSPARSPWR